MRMPRSRKGARALGPHHKKDGRAKPYEIVFFGEDGKPTGYESFETKAEAIACKAFFQSQLTNRNVLTDEALDAYELHLKDQEENAKDSIYLVRQRVETFFGAKVGLTYQCPRCQVDIVEDNREAPVCSCGLTTAVKDKIRRQHKHTSLPLWALTETTCKRLYEELTHRYAAATHRNILANTKTFLNWCVKQGYCKSNPAAGVEGKGKRKKGKTQLKKRDLRAWIYKALELAEANDEGAIAALMALVIGMRASEIVDRDVGDLDEQDEPFDTIYIWERDEAAARHDPDYENSLKTEASRRELEVDELIRPFLVAWVGERKFGPLFPTPDGKHHWRDWVKTQVHRICELANVPLVTAHSMRGVLADQNLRRGGMGEAIRAFLGHTDLRVTEGYARPGAKAAGDRRHGLKLLLGGKDRGKKVLAE